MDANEIEPPVIDTNTDQIHLEKDSPKTEN
jgi:hypothetical protein